MMWFNGELRSQSPLNASSAGVLLGWGVFTTLGVRDRQPRFLQRHFARLERDARMADVPFNFDFALLERGLSEVLDANQIKNGHARLTLTRRGDGRWNSENGADFSILVQETTPLSPTLRTQISRFKVEAKRPLVGVKITAYLPYLWAWREAKRQGFDEAILCEGRDYLCEGARSSLFWMRDGALHTPSLKTGCLDGIGRDLALEWARETNLEVREGEFGALEIEAASEIWLISAATGPRAITAWHDENSAERVKFAGFGDFGAGLKSWFESIASE